MWSHFGQWGSHLQCGHTPRESLRATEERRAGGDPRQASSDEARAPPPLSGSATTLWSSIPGQCGYTFRNPPMPPAPQPWSRPDGRRPPNSMARLWRACWWSLLKVGQAGPAETGQNSMRRVPGQPPRPATLRAGLCVYPPPCFSLLRRPGNLANKRKKFCALSGLPAGPSSGFRRNLPVSPANLPDTWETFHGRRSAKSRETGSQGLLHHQRLC